MAELEIRVKGGAPFQRPLSDRPFYMGRSLDNDLPFPGDPYLSKHHLAIEPEGACWCVRDRDSLNGTFLNGVRLTGRHLLQSGDRLEVGEIAVTFSDGPALPRQLRVSDDKAIDDHLRDQTRLQINLRQAVGSGFAADETLSAEHGGMRGVRWWNRARQRLRKVPVVPPSEITPRGPRWQALIEAGRELPRHGSIPELFCRILDLALRAVSAERGILATDEPCGLLIRAAQGEGFLLSTTVRERVLDKRESLLIVDVRNEPGFKDRSTIERSSVRSLMAVPLQTDEKVIGLLYIASSTMRPFTPDDLALLTVLANIAAVRIENERYFEREQKARDLHSELQKAYEIQRGLLPDHAPALDLIDIAGLSIPCHMVAGDYFDYHQMPDGQWLVLVADVSGKGLPAALLAAGLQSRVQVLVEECQGPECLLARLNRGVCGVWPPDRFATLFGLVLDPDTASFTYTNGGHNPPLLVRASGDFERLEEGGLPIGMIKAAPYVSSRNRLDPGDVLLLYTDGIVEAESASGDEFGEERLAEAVLSSSRASASDVLAAVRDAVASHAGGIAAHDDFTVVALMRR